MSLQRSQTSSGMTPTRMSKAKALQPRHTASADSRKAAVPRRASTTWAANQWSRIVSTRAVSEKATPMPWANRLGGPGTRFPSIGRRGVTTRVTSWPSGLNVGPVTTRATKP